ncbi:hypothetical protein [Microbacterium testaceum]|uniref:hypothetical protein n=1 Tax=Microbacterium testaceum TaxID=2033 RepID=UPI00128EE0A8|nr:hypothetical protein [Microbacterium testaceum]
MTIEGVLGRASFLPVALLVGATLAGCGAQTGPVTDQFDLPGDWIQLAPDVAARSLSLQPGEVGMRLYADGKAEVYDLPTGAEKKVDHYVCFDRSGETYSGDATWTASDTGVLRVKYSDDETVFWGDVGKFGSMDWTELVLADCDEAGRTRFGGPGRSK